MKKPQYLTLSQFLTGATVFEGGLLVVAFLLGWLVNISPTAQLTWSWKDFGLGVAATSPMLLVLAAGWMSKLNGMQQIRELVRNLLGPFLVRCRLLDMLFLALLAGVCEEVLFRGLLYTFLDQWSNTLAVVVSSVMFALAHAVTPFYTFFAGVMGLYLCALMAMDQTPNLLIPITAHTLYDFAGIILIARDYRGHQTRPAADNAGAQEERPDEPDSSETPAEESDQISEW